MCRSADPSICVAPALDFLKQPTFCVIKIRKSLLQLQFTINSETITFSMFLPRLADPVPSCCSSPYSTLSCPAGERWCLILCTSCSLICKSCGNETFLCDDIKLNTYLDIQFAVIYEKILPWWVSKLRNVGKIPQVKPHLLKNDLSIKMNAIDDALFQELSLVNSNR